MSLRHSQHSVPMKRHQREAFNPCTPPKEKPMEARLNFFKCGPEAMKAMAPLDQQIARSRLQKSLVEQVRLRASQLNGCAYCIDVHIADARKAGNGELPLATVAVWRETPFFNDRERASLEWAESVTRVTDTRVPDDVWDRGKPLHNVSPLCGENT
jgi:AhpD family alkylhydroperoxidase